MKKLTLERKDAIESGIFGYLNDEYSRNLFCTLEHAYPDGVGGFIPKMAPGEYTCVRGTHTLEHHPKTFETFEITGIPDFEGKPVTKILLHIGNWNADSEGCVLLGEQIGHMLNGGLMLMKSGNAFEKFMDLMKGIDAFTLVVENLI